MSGVVIALETQTLKRWRAAVSSAETYSSNAFRETRQIPRLPIFTAVICPDLMSVYTCEIETRSTSATSSGVMNLCVSLINSPIPTSHPLLRVMHRTVTAWSSSWVGGK